MSVYSKRLGTVSAAAGGPTAVFTVPAGETYVVRCIMGLCTSSSPTVASLKVGATFLGAIDCPANDAQILLNCRLVLEAGETLTVEPNAGTLLASFSGYALTP